MTTWTHKEVPSEDETPIWYLYRDDQPRPVYLVQPYDGSEIKPILDALNLLEASRDKGCIQAFTDQRFDIQFTPSTRKPAKRPRNAR